MRYIEDAMRTDARWTCRSTLLYVRFLLNAVKLETQSIWKLRGSDAVAHRIEPKPALQGSPLSRYGDYLLQILANE